MGSAKFVPSVINLIVNVLGVGVLTISWALTQTSVVNGIALLVIMCVLNIFAFHLIARCCEASGSFSYLDMGRMVLGRRGGVVVQAVVLFHTYFSCVSYTIFIGDLLPKAITSTFDSDLHLGAANFRALVIAVLTVAVLTPLALVKKLEFLKYTSFSACVGIAFLVCVVAYRFVDAPSDTVPWEKRNVLWFAFEPCLLPAVPILSLSFCAHFNGPDYFKELEDRSVKRFTHVAAVALIICLLVGVAVALLGELTWGDKVAKILLDNYGKDPEGHQDKVVVVLQWVFALVIAWTLPSMFFSVKQGFFSLFFPNMNRSSLTANVLSVCVLFSAVAIGIVFEQITVVLVYLGAISGSSIVYIFPALLWLGFSTASEGQGPQEMLITTRFEDWESSPEFGARGPLLPSVWTPLNILAAMLLAWGVAMSICGVLFEALAQSGVFTCG